MKVITATLECFFYVLHAYETMALLLETAWITTNPFFSYSFNLVSPAPSVQRAGSMSPTSGWQQTHTDGRGSRGEKG